MSSRRSVLVFVLLLTALGTIVLFAALSLRRPAVPSSSPSVVLLDVPSSLEESEPPDHPLALGRLHLSHYTVFAMVDAIHRASQDDHVGALVLHIEEVNWGWAKLTEVRDALREFAASGKPLLASLSGGGEAEYFLASAATTISMPPTAALQLDGLAISAIFMRGAFDKFGISPNFQHVGQYKSAVEGYTRTGMSAPSREALAALLGDQYRTLTDSLAAARGVPADTMRSRMDEGPYDASAAHTLGLIDTLLYEAEVDSLAARRGTRRLATLGFQRYLDRLRSPRSGTHIAMVTASGAIAAGRSRVGLDGEWVLGAETLIDALEQVRARHAIKAVVLRIDSPGGDAQASDEIWHEIMRCRRVKPVVASLSDLAASGGYYIAVGADSIVAEPSTITGSIGIFGGKFNVAGLLQKIGLNVETVSRGRHAEMMSPYRDFTPEESERYQQHLESFYRGFVSRVAMSRQRSTAYVDSVGQGRVWSGVAARDLGLVDALGGLDAAIGAARAKAGLSPDAEIVIERFPRVHYSFIQRVVDSFFSEDEEKSNDSGALSEALRTWIAASRFRAGTVLALMPFTLTIR